MGGSDRELSGARREFRIREAGADDGADIVALLSVTLGWESDGRHRALFEWKHRLSPFGPSPIWVASDAEGLVGSRPFMRWRFRCRGETLHAVRAVDTATHPRAQGQGVFRHLTMTGVEAMTDAGVDWVFNTPNARSAPGYARMGWKRMGHLAVTLSPASWRSVPRLVRSRHPAQLWSAPCSAGESAASVLEGDAVPELLASQPEDTAVRTELNRDYLSWRYAACPVGYRAVLAGRSVTDGVAFFRVRRRGTGLEAVVGDVLVPGGDARRVAQLRRRVLDVAGADYAVWIGSGRPRRGLAMPAAAARGLRVAGPLLMWRPLARATCPPIERWELGSGDIELL